MCVCVCVCVCLWVPLLLSFIDCSTHYFFAMGNEIHSLTPLSHTHTYTHTRTQLHVINLYCWLLVYYFCCLIVFFLPLLLNTHTHTHTYIPTRARVCVMYQSILHLLLFSPSIYTHFSLTHGVCVCVCVFVSNLRKR